MKTDTPESLRAEAAECGKRANAYRALKQWEEAKAEISKAQQLVMAAMQMELEAKSEGA